MSLLVRLLFVVCLMSYPALAAEEYDYAIPRGSIKVNVAKDLGRVVYDHSRARREFSQVAGAQITRDTAGLTIAKLMIDGSTEVQIVKVAGGFRVYLTAVNMQLFYGDIYVLIDKQYPVGSCEYNAIIAHENNHVGIARLVIDFYTPYVKSKIEEIVAGMKPVDVRNRAQADAINRRYNREVMDKLQPMMDLIREQLEKGNAQLDTPENYRKDTAKCRNW